METTTIKTVSYVYGTELTNAILNTVDCIKMSIDNYNSSVKYDSNEILQIKTSNNFNFEEELKKNLSDKMSYLSKSKQKKLNKMIYFLEQKMNDGKIHIKSINVFFHFLCSKVLETSGRISIEQPLRVQNISKAKKEFKESQRKQMKP